MAEKCDVAGERLHISTGADPSLPSTNVFTHRRAALPVHYRTLRAVLYGASVLLSCFLMLVFMTYNVRRLAPIVSSWFLTLGSGVPHLCGRCRRCHRALSL